MPVSFSKLDLWWLVLFDLLPLFILSVTLLSDSVLVSPSDDSFSLFFDLDSVHFFEEDIDVLIVT